MIPFRFLFTDELLTVDRDITLQCGIERGGLLCNVTVTKPQVFFLLLTLTKELVGEDQFRRGGLTR